MKALKLLDASPAICRAVSSEDYSSPEMKMTEVSCEKGFCESGISTQSDHAGFDIKNNYGNEFWED